MMTYMNLITFFPLCLSYSASNLGCEGARLHAFGVSCLLVCLTPRSTESPGRHVQSYPVQMGPSSRQRRNCTVSARGEFVSVSPDSLLGGGPGIELVLLFAIIFLYILFFSSRVTLSFNVPANVIRTSGQVYALTSLACLVSASLTVRTLWESTACQDYFQHSFFLAFSYCFIGYIFNFDLFLCLLSFPSPTKDDALSHLPDYVVRT